jgi:hypothetical protein
MNFIATSIIQELQKQNERLKKQIEKLKENKILIDLYYFFICIYLHILFIIRAIFNPVY